MTGEELRATGIQSLTPAQRSALDKWLSEYKDDHLFMKWQDAVLEQLGAALLRYPHHIALSSPHCAILTTLKENNT